jgi:DNA-directed RNA polymerase subunit RPC12/RpoP
MKDQCISCGRDDQPLFPTDGAFMPEGYKTCASCQARYRSSGRDGAKLRSPGLNDLAHEADRIMLEKMIPEEYYCYACHSPVVMDHKGMVSLYCHDCMHRIFAAYKPLRN